MPSTIVADCPDANVIASMVVDDALEQHLDRCADCRMLVSQLAIGRTMADVEPESGPDDIDRYVVMEQLGTGGMGTVFAAYDPDLDRRIAIKVLRGVGSDLREARAIARVTHENVIAVFDVGTHGDDLFIAMELVDGTTLAAWLAEPHTDREILDVFSRAGRGLAAAHEAGLVHGDFKPENVLVGRNQQVRVSDFGLAERLGAASRGGTVAYMAPEQRSGGAIDGRTDQFAFCVALASALKSPTKRVQRALARGRSVDPDARFPTMTSLLAALDRDPHAAA